jgi:hypothetical protein
MPRLRAQHWELEEEERGDEADGAALSSSPHPLLAPAPQAGFVPVQGSPTAARGSRQWGLSSLLGLGSETPLTPLSLTSVSPSDSEAESRGGSTSEASSAAAGSSARSGGRRSRRHRDRSDSGSASEDHRHSLPAIASERDYVWNEFRRRPHGTARGHLDDEPALGGGRPHAEETPTVDEAGGRRALPRAFALPAKSKVPNMMCEVIVQASRARRGLDHRRRSRRPAVTDLGQEADKWAPLVAGSVQAAGAGQTAS